MKTILLIDDNPVILQLITEILESDGYGLCVCNGSGSDCQGVADCINLIISDVNMNCKPRNCLKSNVPVIYISGDCSLIECLKHEGKLALAKPFRVHELKELLNVVLSD